MSMIHRMRTVILFVGLAGFSHCFAAEQKINIPIEHWTLKNKTKVYFVQRKQIPMLDIEVVFPAGSVYDGKKPGLANLTSTMIGEGTKKRSDHQIALQFEEVGAKFDRFTTRDMTTIHLRTVTNKADMDKAIEIFKDVILHPTFDANTLVRVKKQLTTAIQLQDEDPWLVAKNIFYKNLYHNFGYATNPLGTVKSIRLIKRKELLQFYRRFYSGENADVIIVGDISKDHAVRISNEILRDLPNGKPAPTLVYPTPLDKTIYKHIKLPLSQSTIMIGQLGINNNNKDYFPLVVANTIFGSMPLTSILFDEVREKRGYAYSAYSVFKPLKYKGPFIIALQTKESNTKPALNLVYDLLSKYIKSGPSETQLQKAKENLTGQFPLAIASNADILNVLTTIVFYHLPLDYLDTYRDKINQVTLSDIQKALQNKLDPKHLLIVTVGPTDPTQDNQKS